MNNTKESAHDINMMRREFEEWCEVNAKDKSHGERSEMFHLWAEGFKAFKPMFSDIVNCYFYEHYRVKAIDNEMRMLIAAVKQTYADKDGDLDPYVMQRIAFTEEYLNNSKAAVFPKEPMIITAKDAEYIAKRLKRVAELAGYLIPDDFDDMYIAATSGTLLSEIAGVMAPHGSPRSQSWKGMSGAVAFQLIDRHAEGWGNIELMMNEWLEANKNV